MSSPSTAGSDAMHNGHSHRKSRSLKIARRARFFTKRRADDVVFGIHLNQGAAL